MKQQRRIRNKQYVLNQDHQHLDDIPYSILLFFLCSDHFLFHHPLYHLLVSLIYRLEYSSLFYQQVCLVHTQEIHIVTTWYCCHMAYIPYHKLLFHKDRVFFSSIVCFLYLTHLQILQYQFHQIQKQNRVIYSTLEVLHLLLNFVP